MRLTTKDKIAIFLVAQKIVKTNQPELGGYFYKKMRTDKKLKTSTAPMAHLVFLARKVAQRIQYQQTITGD